jgi:hypothetical protein
VRIAGVLVPPGYLRWAAAGAGVVLLGTLIATAVGIAGLFGASVEDQGSTVEARVVAGSPCDKPGATEKVRFTMDEKDHEVRFDGCGHAEEERVAVTVPNGPLTGDLVVHAAEAAVGDSKDGEVPGPQRPPNHPAAKGPAPGLGNWSRQRPPARTATCCTGRSG